MAHILIVEDEQVLERILTLNLAKRGYAVAEARTVAEADALARAADPPFDLVILDINLPDQTGWNLLRLWRSRPDFRLPPIIVATAVRPSEERLREFCPVAVLVKPFPIETLLRLIERALTPAGEKNHLVLDPFDP
ncbi:MAG TPA: response regulator [Ktedonobacterales bacterium]|nr:response regulator [Ktedonobacterales bacterium]